MMKGSDQAEEEWNLTPFDTRFALIKLTMAAHMAPAALQVTALHRLTIWALVAAVLCVAIIVSAGFRFLWSNVLLFRYSTIGTVVIQLAAFGLSKLLSANWPMIVGFALAFAFGVLCVVCEAEIARKYNIPE